MKNFLIIAAILVIFQNGNAQQIHFHQQEQQEETGCYNPLRDFFGWILSEITYGILIESFLEKDTPMHDAGITPYPYFYKDEGNYTYDNNPVPFRLEVNTSGHLAPAKTYFGSTGVKLRFLKRASVQIDYVKLPGNPADDYVSQTGISFSYYRIRTRRFDLWYGLGTMFAENPSGHNALTYHIGSELFIRHHLSVEGQAYWAYFEPVTIKNYQLQINYFLSHWRFNAGIKNYIITGNHINSIGFGIKYYF